MRVLAVYTLYIVTMFLLSSLVAIILFIAWKMGLTDSSHTAVFPSFVLVFITFYAVFISGYYIENALKTRF